MLVSHSGAKEVDGLSTSQRNRLIAAGAYPRPVQLTTGRVAFVKDEVEAWARARIEARDRGVKPSDDPVLVATHGKTGRRGRPPRSAARVLGRAIAEGANPSRPG